MAFFMGIIKGKNGVFCARKRVPSGCEEKAAFAASSNRPKLSWLKRSLGTKDRREAAVLAKPVLIEFDAILAKAQSAEFTPEGVDLTPVAAPSSSACHRAHGPQGRVPRRLRGGLAASLDRCSPDG